MRFIAPPRSPQPTLPGIMPRSRLYLAPHQPVKVARVIERPYNSEAAHQAPIDKHLGHRFAAGGLYQPVAQSVVVRHVDHLEGVAPAAKEALGSPAAPAAGLDVDGYLQLVHLCLRVVFIRFSLASLTNNRHDRI